MTKEEIKRHIALLQKLLDDAPEGESSKRADNRPDYQCSFCGKPQSAAGGMAEGPNGVYICNSCVVLAFSITQNEQRKLIDSLRTKASEPEPR